MQMNGYIAGPFQVVLGTHLFAVEIYVVPIEEDMLLGLDFLEDPYCFPSLLTHTPDSHLHI
jgi:hypothetical protein